MICDCDWVAMMVNHRQCPISYADDSGFFLQGPDGARYPIHHCPWCGKPVPKRVGEGPIAPGHEYARIFDKATTIEKPEQCVEVFGEPDYDAPFPDEMGMPTELRNIEYYNVSQWYTLEFYFQDPDFHRFVIHPKSIPL